MTRTLPKLFFGVQAFMRIDDDLEKFEHIFGFLLGRVNDKGKFILGNTWWTWPKLDEINKKLALVTGLMAKGMTLDLCTAYFY